MIMKFALLDMLAPSPQIFTLFKGGVTLLKAFDVIS